MRLAGEAWYSITIISSKRKYVTLDNKISLKINNTGRGV